MELIIKVGAKLVTTIAHRKTSAKPADSQVQTSVSHAPIKKRQQVDVFHGRADRIASPSTHFRAATYVAKMLR
jgi:hypothetical protein